MPSPELMNVVTLATSALFVPLVSTLWLIQGRLSKIEGRLEAMAARSQQ
ncbi:MAG TPA: hypothetical protein VJM50_16815 [Pyrinomonadaceae bacterium]|nr:hypothetical protein [Pyrinomonadaceae bacterium]